MLKLKKLYKSGSAIESISEAILSGEISGEISQNEFANSLGISRIPVREALIALEYQGLVERLKNQHVKIITLDYEAIKNLFIDMSLLEIETIKNLQDRFEILDELAMSENQIIFHRNLYSIIKSPLRKNILKIIIETYLVFLLKRCNNTNSIFECLRNALTDINKLTEIYRTYSEILTSDFVTLREKINNHAQLETN